MKKALYYSLRHGYNGDISYCPIAVTSERGSRWYGRDLQHGNSTSGRIRELTGRFETEEELNNKVQGVRDIAAVYSPIIKELDAKRKETMRAWGKADREFLTGTTEG